MKLSIAIVTALLLGFGLQAQAQKSVGGGVIGATGGATVTSPIVKAPSTDYVAVGVSVAGVNSWDSSGSPNNEWLYEGTGGTGALMAGVSWDVTITALGYSWLSEALIYFDGSDQDGSGLWLRPGYLDSFPGTGTYSSGGVLDLTDNGIPDVPVLTDGLIWMEFNESYDDGVGAIDATWTAGTVGIYYGDCGNAVSFGSACPGAGGFLPAFAIDGCPMRGATVSISITNCQGGAPLFMCFAAGTGSQPLPGGGCTLDLAPGWIYEFLGYMPGAGPGGGSITFPVTIPNSGHIFIQCVVKDSTVGFITTNGLDITIAP